MSDPAVAAAHRDLVQRQVGLYQQKLEVGVETGTLPPDMAVEDVTRHIVALDDVDDVDDVHPLFDLDCGEGRTQTLRAWLHRDRAEGDLGVKHSWGRTGGVAPKNVRVQGCCVISCFVPRASSSRGVTRSRIQQPKRAPRFRER